MGLKRLLSITVFALAASIVLVPGAAAGNFDEERMGCSGGIPAVCPSGTTGQPYSLKFLLQGDEDLGCAVFSVSSGSLPTGLSMSPGGIVSGVPTQAGAFDFFATVTYVGCAKPASDDAFRIPIVPGLPKLTIGPESAGPATTGVPYSLQMTASALEPKTWSINSGALPSGLAIDASTGLISGTPTGAGQFNFTVLAKMNGDIRSDSKALGISVRDPLTVTGPDNPPLEVGVGYKTALKASGGLPKYIWTLTAGALPPGFTFWPGGAITGKPTTAGTYEFTATLTDSEGRTVPYEGSLTVAARLAIATTQLKGKVGRPLRKEVLTSGGVEPTAMLLKKGPLPRGVRFDRRSASFVGLPTKAGTYTVLVEVVDGLKVKAKGSIVITIAPGRAKP